VPNVSKHAPGPWLLTPAVEADALRASAWDTDPALPAVVGSDPPDLLHRSAASPRPAANDDDIALLALRTPVRS
jgi:hypothetical protein